jgi:hypothetical protein
MLLPVGTRARLILLHVLFHLKKKNAGKILLTGVFIKVLCQL